MKRSITKIFTIAACAAMMLTAAPVANMQSVQAATKAQGTVNLATKKLVISKGVKTAMTNNTLTMVKNRRYQVKAKFGSTTVSTKGTYKSSKPAVATVSSTGLVTAKAPGTATIKVTYNGKSQSFKVKVIASHTHAWKTISKATCATKGKKLCQTCGATGTTAMKTTHDFKVTKKATCARKGTQTCTVCGVTENIAKTAHNYETKTWTDVEGKGKPYFTATFYCNGCDIEITNWTSDQRDMHRTDITSMDAGTANWNCFNAGTHGEINIERYNKYAMVKNEETYCKTCGAYKDLKETELYEVYYDDWRNVVRKSDNKIIEESDAYKKYKPYLEAAGKLTASNAVVATQTSKDTNIVLEDTESDVILADDSISDSDVIADDTISTDAPVISDNTVVSDNNTDITDPNGGSDIVFEDDSFDDEEDSDSDGVLVIEDDDEEVIEDE